MKFDKLKQILT